MIRILFFGPVAERIGSTTLLIEFNQDVTLQKLREELAARYPQAFDIVCATALNGEHVFDMSQVLADNSEVAFMAKFSGG